MSYSSLLTIKIGEGEGSIQLRVQQLAHTLHPLGVIDGEYCYMVPCYVTQLAARDVHLQVHARPVTSLVKLTDHLHLRQERVLRIVRPIES